MKSIGTAQERLGLAHSMMKPTMGGSKGVWSSVSKYLGCW